MVKHARKILIKKAKRPFAFKRLIKPISFRATFSEEAVRSRVERRLASAHITGRLDITRQKAVTSGEIQFALMTLNRFRRFAEPSQYARAVETVRTGLEAGLRSIGVSEPILQRYLSEFDRAVSPLPNNPRSPIARVARAAEKRGYRGDMEGARVRKLTWRLKGGLSMAIPAELTLDGLKRWSMNILRQNKLDLSRTADRHYGARLFCDDLAKTLRENEEFLAPIGSDTRDFQLRAIHSDLISVLETVFKLPPKEAESYASFVIYVE